MSFEELGLRPDLMRAVTGLGYTQPTPIQHRAIPPALAGRDLLASAETGSGKTAAFLLPILERLSERRAGGPRALVLSPTRELAAQTHQAFRDLGRHTRLSAAAIFGGVGMGGQEQALRRGVDLVVATPGRLLDHLRLPYLRFDRLEVLVLDEADRMLDLGFLPDIQRILKRLPARRQTLLFSATLPAPIVELARGMLVTPEIIRLERTAAAPPPAIAQSAYPVSADRKAALLVELLKRGEIRNVIAFTRTKHRANRLADYLERNGVAADRIHGNRSQSQRTQALARFKAGKFPVLVATDLVSRGIDVDALSHVVNFDVPACPEDYVHRIGRTGRAAASGDALAFVAPEDEGNLKAIERVLGKRLPRVTLPGFDYTKGPEAAPLERPRPAFARPGARGRAFAASRGRRR
jgi:ATP-dependent RNA helicase RhlE